MNADDIKRRTKAFALDIIKLIENIPHSKSSDVICRQIVKCGTSIGANYRAACRARSTREFIAKMYIVLEEADETIYWLEIVADSKLCTSDIIGALISEANQIVAIAVSSIKTAKKKMANQNISN